MNFHKLYPVYFCFEECNPIHNFSRNSAVALPIPCCDKWQSEFFSAFFMLALVLWRISCFAYRLIYPKAMHGHGASEPGSTAGFPTNEYPRDVHRSTESAIAAKEFPAQTGHHEKRANLRVSRCFVILLFFLSYGVAFHDLRQKSGQGRVPFAELAHTIHGAGCCARESFTRRPL
jgi:hypothetical protein